MNWVRQEESNGCGVACLAMILGKTYAEIRDELSVYRPDNTGLDNHIIDEYLADKGYAVARKYEAAHWSQEQYGRTQREEWPCKPFADVHLIQVQYSIEPSANHYLIMLRDGTTLDPLTERRLPYLTYPKVYNVTGIVKIDPTQGENNE